MTAADGFPQRLTAIDNLTCGDRWYLRLTDVYRYLGEYTAGKGFAYSATNSLILDFKMPVSRTGRRNRPKRRRRSSAQWRPCGRVRWLFHRFRSEPQSGSHDRVSSPPARQ